MKDLTRRLVLLTVLVTVSAVSIAAADASDVDAIRQVQQRQADAWNQHDAAAYSALFTADGDVVNILGWWWQGRTAIESKLTNAFAWVFRDSKMAIVDVHVRMLTATLAIAHVQWRMEGAKAPPGAAEPPRQGIQLQVLRKVRDHWLIESIQNTNAFPELPFPLGPPPTPIPKP